MKYYYLKLGFKNQEASARLGASKPTAVIYFGTTMVKEFLAGNGDKQGQDFCRAGLSENRERMTMIVSHQGKIWILEPAGEVYEESAREHPDTKDWYIPKVMPVKILEERDSLDVPAVLAEIHNNAWLGRGTFREITHWGNIKAIESVLGRGIPKNHVDEGPTQLLECLGSTELETLVAKLLDSSGCFIEAYRGGTRWAVDVVAHNDKQQEISIGSLLIKPKSRAAIQVKGWTNLTQPEEGVDYLVGFIENPTSPHAFGSDWLLNQVKQKAPVAAWLRRSLQWLPQDYLAKWEI